MNYSYDEIYGVDIEEYCSLHNTTPQDLINKINIDIQILKNRLKEIINEDDHYLISVVYELINKKEKHKDRLIQ
jgi:hypothetical protein